jgi:hypothetical protein
MLSAAALRIFSASSSGFSLSPPIFSEPKIVAFEVADS